MTTEFIWPIRVYYEDTDAGGVVYHANYLKFYERARTEWLNQIGIDQVALLKENVVFVVTNANVEFLKPAKLNNQLQVKSRINNLKSASLEFEQQLWLEKENQNCEKLPAVLLNRVSVKVACVKLASFSPCRIPTKVKEELQRVS